MTSKTVMTASLWLSFWLLCCVPGRGFGQQTPALISTGTRSGLRLFAPNGNDWWFDPLAGRLDIRVNGGAVPLATLNSLGNLGIGTTNPTRLLSIGANLGIGSDGSQHYALGAPDGVGMYWPDNTTLDNQYIVKIGNSLSAKTPTFAVTGSVSASVQMNSAGGFTAPDGNPALLFRRDSVLDTEGQILKIADGNGGATQIVSVTGNGLRVTRGNVGIGTTSPAGKLDVSGTICLSGTNCISSWPTGGSPAYGAAGTASNNSVYIIGGGNVGIGTTSPQQKLDVSGDINTSSLYEIAGSTVLSVNGSRNIFVGVAAGTSTTTGYQNAFLGYQAGAANTSGGYNTFLGYQAGFSNTDAQQSVFVGYRAGYSNLVGGNVFLGPSAGSYNTTGGYNVFVGNGAGGANTTANFNTFVGYAAGAANTTGNTENTFLGFNAGSRNTTGVANVFLGGDAGRSNTTADYNTIVGVKAGYSNTTGVANSFLGEGAGFNNTTGGNNTILGFNAGPANTTADKNTVVGGSSFASNTTGGNNTVVGYQALALSTGGVNNTVVGYFAGYGASNTSSNNNSLFGYQAGKSLTTGSNNIEIGYYADAIPAASSNMLNLGNLIFGSGLNGTGSALSTGNVGIGTTGPGAKLEVAGQVKITGGTPGANKVLTSDAAGLASWQTPQTTSAVFSASFTSSEIAVGSGDKTASHGLGGIPTLFTAVIRCKIAELGYAVDDELLIYTTDNSESAYRNSVFANSTIVGVALGTRPLLVSNRSTGGFATVTVGNWKVVLRAWK